jgi:hypothetical protein
MRAAETVSCSEITNNLKAECGDYNDIVTESLLDSDFLERDPSYWDEQLEIIRNRIDGPNADLYAELNEAEERILRPIPPELSENPLFRQIQDGFSKRREPEGEE